MPVRMIALDLDRTTLTRTGHLTQENKRVLEAAIRAGIQIVPASGRALDTFPKEILELRGLNYIITSNGAAIYQLLGKQPVCLRRFLLKPEMVNKILELTEKEAITYEAFVNGKAYADPSYIRTPTAFGAVKEAVPYIQRTRTPVEDIRSFLCRNKERLDSVDLIVGKPQKKQQLMAMLEEECPEVYLTTSVEQLIEVSDRRAGKHSAVKFLRERLGIDREETVAFGDGDNDAEMLADAGTGIAVANASLNCMEAADAVTLSCDEDGVAYGIREILGLSL